MNISEMTSALPTDAGAALAAQASSPWRRSGWLTALAVALIGLLGAAATFVAWRQVTEGQLRDTQTVVTDQARAKSNDVQGVMSLVQEAVYGVGAHLASAPDDALFDAYAKSALARHDAIVAIGWIDNFKPVATDKPGSFRGQAITQRDWLGNFVASTPKASYLPLARLALGKSAADQATALQGFVGFDFSSDERWQDTLTRARQANTLELSYTGLGAGDSLLFLPVKRAGAAAADDVSGYVVAAVALPQLMSRALGADAGSLINRVFDASDPSGLKLIFPTGAAAAPAGAASTAATTQATAATATPAAATADERALGRQLMQRQPLQVLGKPWLVETEPQVSLLRERSNALPWLVLGLGGLTTALLATYVAALRNRNVRVERLVNQRTQQLNRAYSDLRDTEIIAMQSEKMSSLGQMVAGVAHEINTPLGFVSSNLQMLRDLVGQAMPALQQQITLMQALPNWRSYDSDQKRDWYRRAMLQTQALEEIVRQQVLEDGQPLVDESLVGLDRINEIVTTLKDFSRVDRAQLDAVDLHHCIDSTLVIAHNVVKHKAQVIKDYGELPPVKCSPSQINQVILNLVTNAAQAIPETAPGHIWITTRVVGGNACIDIRDDGPGIPPDVQARLFEPFFTTKGVGQGTGLGLSICQKIMQTHGGAVSFASTVGQGTTFTISLPIQAAAGAARATASAAEESKASL
jgi:signal transduction histidine kinase